MDIIIFALKTTSFRYQLERNQVYSDKSHSPTQALGKDGQNPLKHPRLGKGRICRMWPLLRILLLGVMVREGLTRRVEWADGDTIIVEATREEDVGKVGVPFQRNDVPFFYHAPTSLLPQRRRGRQGRDRVRRSGSRTARAYVHTCYSVLGDQGHCTTFNECFPMLYYTEGEHKGQIKHPVLADLLMSTSGPCQPPPLSFRDDFVPYEGEEEMQQAVLDLDFVNRKDLICCPSTKGTAIPTSGELKPPSPRPSQGTPVIERVWMRTTPSTSTTTPQPGSDSNPIKPGGSAPDAVAGFMGHGAGQAFPSGDVAASPGQTSTSPTSKPNPGMGQWGHRFPTRSTTTTTAPPPPPAQHENDISEWESESDEEEEKKVAAFVKLPSRLTATNPPAVKIPQSKPTSGDVSAPSNIPKLTFPAPSGSVSPSTEKTNGVDVSVPLKPVPTSSRPTTRPYKRPYVPTQGHHASGDVYVPVIAVGSMTPDDSVVVHNPTPSSPLPSHSPRPIYPDAAPSFPFQATKVEITGSGTTREPAKPEGVQVTQAPADPAPPVTQGEVEVDSGIPLLIPTTTGIPALPELDLTEVGIPSETPVPVPTTTTTTTTTERPKLPLVMDKAPCGRLNSSADPKHPWVAAIKLGPKFICAGSLIDEYHVLTSAACVSHLSTLDIGKLRVYLGERILNSNIDGPTIVRRVLRAMRHRGFSITTLRNDIALLKLSLPIPIGTKRVKPVCLPLDEDRNLFFETSSEATIVGWSSNWNQVQNDVTQESNLTVWTKDACLDKYRYFIPETHFDDEDMLCAQHSTDQSSPKTLVTDFTQEVETDGSPLIVKGKNGIYQQIGISSWKLGSLSTFPRVLTRVSAYRHWIEKNRLRP